MTRLRLFFCCLLLATPLDAQDAAPPDALAILDQVFVTAQRANTSVAGAALQQAALRQQAGSAELSELLRERSDLADQAELEQRRLSFAIGETGAAAEAEVARIQARLREIETKTAELDAAIEAGFPDFRELINPRPMDVAEVQATLGEGEVLLFTLSGTWETYIWAISRDRADWHAVFFPDPDEMKGRVTALRRLLSSTENARAAEAMSDDGDSFPAIRAFDRGLAHGIYGDLLAPLAHVFDGAEHLLLVPDGPLTSLPFGLLIASEPQGADDDPFALRDTDWLIKRHALTVLPNVSSLRALRRDEAEAPADRRPFVGFGDPIFAYGRDDLGPTGIVAEGDYVTRGAFEELSEVANLAQLPGTRRELRRLALLTGADMERDLFLGEAATESAVRAADLEDVEILAFATHGLLAGELSGLAEPALVFTPPGEPGEEDDALLTASEAAGLRLSADLIILSACNTAASDGTPGSDGLSGLARSFIYAGAQSILVSHWPVDDRATVALTTGMVGQMAEGTSRAAALRTAMLALMEDDADPRYAHPRFWAPFILVGEGA